MVKLFKFLVLSMAILSVGFTLFYMVANLEPEPGEKLSAIQSPQPAAPMATLSNGQRNLLVIATDDLTLEQPDLISIWLVLFVPPEPHLTLMPVYPSSTSGITEKDAALEAAFHLGSQKHELSQEFLQALHSRNLWWSEYAVMDEYALTHILNGLSPDGKNTSEAGEASTQNNSNAQNPQPVLLNQATRYQEVCWRIARQESVELLIRNKNFDQLMSGHIYSDLTKKDALAELSQLQIPSNGLYCEFPTLSIQTRASW